MNKKTWCSILFAAMLTLCLSGQTMAQDVGGNIVGTVHDSNGAPVVGATVTVTDSTRNNSFVRTIVTGESGEFSVPNVAVSTFTVTVEAPNFKKSVNTGVKVDAGERHQVDITLTAGKIEESVTVQADAVAVNLSTPTASTIINGEQVRELSLNNRNWAQLITLAPGVSANLQDQVYVGTTNPNGVSNALQIAVNGVRSSSNTYTVDGADTTDRGANLTVQTYPSVDAIQEFSILRSLYPAESGRSSGGQVNVITKSGGAGYHGDVYEFFRNDKLNANNYLTNRTAPLGIDSNGKAKRAPFRYNDFGGTLGGPIPKLKDTFFFFSEEARRVIVYPTGTTTVPSAGLRQGIFPQDVCIGPVANPCSSILQAGTALPTASISPLAAAYVKDIYNKLPLPDASNTLSFPTRGIFNFRQELLRLDHKFGSKVSVYYRFENDSIPTIEPFGLFAGGAGQPLVSTTQSNSPGRTHIGRVTWVQSANTIFEFGASYSYGNVPSVVTGLLNDANSPDIVAHIPSFPFTRTRGRVPTISGSDNGFSGLSTFGPYSDFSYNVSEFASLTKIIGSHTTKYGVSFAKIRKHENSLGGTNEGTYAATTTAPVVCTAPNVPAGCDRPGTQIGGPATATSTTNQLWANFLLGNFQTFTQNQFDLTADLHSSSVEAYAQDEWRFRPNITLYYGLRFSRFGQPWDGNGRLTSFDPQVYTASQAFQVLANGLRVAGTGNVMDGIIVNSQATVAGATVSPWGKAVAPTRNNFAPRVGIAWDPFKKGTTSVRAGYGMYYDQVSFSFYETGLVGTNPPFQASAVINPTTLDNPLAGNPVVSLTAPTVAGIDPNYKTPYVQSWSLDIQHQFGAKTIVTAGYFGSRGVHLTGLVDLDLLPAQYAINLGPTGCQTNNTTPATFGPCQVTGQVFTSSTQELLLNQIRPFRGYNVVRYLETAFDSNYHSLQVTAQHRFTSSSQVNLSYTWSKNLTDSQNESATSPQNTYDLRAEYARANLDRRHVLNVNYIYELPFYRSNTDWKGKVLGGWQFSGITYFYTGLGFSATTSSNDPAGIGFIGNSPSGARPDVNCDPNAGAPHTFNQWFNVTCFANPPAGVNRVGNESRNIILGPSTTRFDATMSKNVRFSESKSLQLRLEAFNVFNHTNFTTFGLSVTTPNNGLGGGLGAITGVRDPRTLQLAAKFYF